MNASIPNEHQLDLLWAKSGGKAWEPPSGLQHPFVAALIDGGWVKISTMRCGFEAFDTGLVWSDAAKRYFAARAASVGRNPQGEDPAEGLRAEHEHAVGAAETPKDQDHDQ